MDWLATVFENATDEQIKEVFRQQHIHDESTLLSLNKRDIEDLCGLVPIGLRGKLRSYHERNGNAFEALIPADPSFTATSSSQATSTTDATSESSTLQEFNGVTTSDRGAMPASECDIYSRLLAKYLDKGMTVRQANTLVGEDHGVWRSQRTAQRHARYMGWTATRGTVSLDSVIKATKSELEGVSRSLGANMIWQRVKTVHGLKVKRQTIRDMIEAIQPGRSEQLKKGCLSRRIYCVKGPNHIWHIDGNDKLKPFGFGISGCIDGYSRKLIWLTIASSNKNPSLICMHYLNAVSSLKSAPKTVRMDKGTENVCIASAQAQLRSRHPDWNLAVMYGSSNHNQRIERFWSYLKRALLLDYMNLFKDYVESGLLDTSNPLHMKCLQTAFMPLLAAELELVKSTWNNHLIRQIKGAVCPSGKPDLLYSYPSLYDPSAVNQAKAVDLELLHNLHKHCQQEVVSTDIVGQPEAAALLRDNNMRIPTNLREAMVTFENLYFTLT